MMMERDIQEWLPEGWDYRQGMLVCPHGYNIELDGSCPEGHVSPLREAGLI